MPLKHYKNEDKEKLAIGQVLYAKRFGLSVDRKLCKGCTICQLVCPRDAISLKSVPKSPDGKARPPLVDIDENKCDFHAICAVTCPFGAINVTVNNEPKTPTVEKEAYPLLLRDITIDEERCTPDCKICEEKCPLGIISVKFDQLTAEEIDERKKKKLPITSKKTIVTIRKELCAACKVCEIECPAKVVKVTKFFNGSIKINQELCPEDCHDCLDVCPVNALFLGNDGKIYVNDMFCIYCGACVNVCPKPEALELSRTSIRHTPVKSGAWNKALEKLTSTSGLGSELRAKRTGKAREAIKNLELGS
ncbi:MAG: 4Fe-4S dicluster domain-containing protein [Candidatus Bathyarchaeota archaeon]